MIESLVQSLVRQMKKENIINASDGEKYEYALLTIIESSLTTATMILLGFMCKQLFQTICFLIFFYSLRKRTGGYHAKKFWLCYMSTVLTFFLVLRVTILLSRNPQIMYMLLGCSIVFIELIGTVNHPNVDMDIYELRESQKAARILVLLESGIILMLTILEFDMLYVSYMSFAIILCAILMCFAKIVKQEVKIK